MTDAEQLAHDLVDLFGLPKPHLTGVTFRFRKGKAPEVEAHYEIPTLTGGKPGINHVVRKYQADIQEN